MENKIRFKAKTAAENQKEQELFEETKALVLKAIESHGSFLTINVINSIVSAKRDAAPVLDKNFSGIGYEFGGIQQENKPPFNSILNSHSIEDFISKTKTLYTIKTKQKAKIANGIYIVNKGICGVINRFDKFVACYLFKGDFFGEADSFRRPDLTYFGDIYAISSEVELYFLTHDNLKRLPFYEVESMIRNSEGDHSKLSFIICNRYKVDIHDLLVY